MKRNFEAWAFYATALLIAAVGYFKPVHMDDAAFLRVAQQLRAYPDDPYGFEWNYLGVATPATVGMPHPPLWPAALALTLGWSGIESMLPHVPMLVTMLLLAMGLRRWLPDAKDVRARWLILFSPVLVIMAQSSMSDVPALALTCLGLGTYVRARKQSSWRCACLAGLYLACAGWTRYAALAAVAYPALHLLRPASDRRARARTYAALACAIPLIAAVLFQGWFSQRYGATHLEYIANYVRFEDVRAPELRLIALLAALALAVAIVPLGLQRPVKSRVPIAILSLSAACAVLGSWRLAQAHGIEMNALQVGLLLLLCSQALMILRAAWNSDRSVATRALLLTTGLALVIATPSGAARYVLPLACITIYALRTALSELSTRHWHVLIGMQAALALLLALADLRAARATSALYQNCMELVAAEPRAPWIRGELSLRYECERLGARYLDQTRRDVREGDLLLRSERATPADSRFHPRAEAALPIAPLRIFEARDAFPVRIFHPYAGAGFYGHRAGLLPFAISTYPHDIVWLHRLRAVPDLFDLERAERVGATEDAALAADFERYLRIMAASPAPQLDAELALHLVARRVNGGVMSLRYDLAIPSNAHVLRGKWAEPTRLMEEPIAGTTTALSIAIQNQDATELLAAWSDRSSARANPADRRWRPIELNLARAAGNQVQIELRCFVPEDEPAPVAVAYAVLARLEIE